MNVSLTDELERFVALKVTQGTYASHSEVVRAGLRLLLERDRRVEAQLTGRGSMERTRLGGTDAGARREHHMDTTGGSAAEAADSPLDDTDAGRGGTREEVGGEALDATALPREVWVHFPEYRGTGLSLETDRETVIERLLEVDDLRAAQWLRERVPTEELRAFMLSKVAPSPGTKANRLWSVLLELPLQLPLE